MVGIRINKRPVKRLSAMHVLKTQSTPKTEGVVEIVPKDVPVQPMAEEVKQEHVEVAHEEVKKPAKKNQKKVSKETRTVTEKAGQEESNPNIIE